MQREKNILKLKNSILISLFSVIILICSRIAIPWVIPFSMQSFGIFLAFGLLGGKKGLISILLFIVMGLMGIPISASGETGLGLFLGPTGGYLIGWILCGIIFWIFEIKWGKSSLTRFISLSIGMVTCYIVGTVWFLINYSYSNKPIGLWAALCYCVFPFIIFDIIKLCIANKLTDSLHKKIKK